MHMALMWHSCGTQVLLYIDGAHQQLPAHSHNVESTGDDGSDDFTSVLHSVGLDQG
jgi:hypothetical protein